MEPLASLDELKNRLDWELEDDEIRVAKTALEDASNLARAHGLNWSVVTVPPIVKSIILAAARRYMVNPQGLTASRAGDETLNWSDVGDAAGSVRFTRDEMQLISSMSRGAGFGSIGVIAWGTKLRPDVGYVPVEGGGKSFPFYASDSEPW